MYVDRSLTKHMLRYRCKDSKRRGLWVHSAVSLLPPALLSHDDRSHHGGGRTSLAQHLPTGRRGRACPSAAPVVHRSSTRRERGGCWRCTASKLGRCTRGEERILGRACMMSVSMTAKIVSSASFQPCSQPPRWFATGRWNHSIDLVALILFNRFTSLKNLARMINKK